MLLYVYVFVSNNLLLHFGHRCICPNLEVTIYFPLLWYSSALLLQCFVGNYCVLFGGQIRQK